MRAALVLIFLSGCVKTDDEPVHSDAVDAPSDWGDYLPPHVESFPPPSVHTDDTDIVDTDIVDTDDTDIVDTDPPLYAMSGEAHWFSSVDGEVVCDVDIDVTGEHHKPRCDRCDRAWAIDTVVTDDRGTRSCDLNRPELFRAVGPDRMAWAPVWVDPFNGRVTEQALLYGSKDGVGDTWKVVLSGTDVRGGPTVSDTSIHWNHDRAWGVLLGPPEGWDACGMSVEESTLTSAPVGRYKSTGTIPCDGSKIDVWTVTVESRVRLVLDTSKATTPFDPWLFVNSLDGCTVWEADDNLTCTHPPPSYGCPAGYLEEGTWQVTVGSRGQCRDGDVDYELRLDGTRTPTVTLTEDNVNAGAVEVHHVRWSAELDIHR
ncbi:MAG: hypothetical protein ACI9MC_003544 [Kiritimatiellia bacterium]|jgi:hypothetical protein